MLTTDCYMNPDERFSVLKSVSLSVNKSQGVHQSCTIQIHSVQVWHIHRLEYYGTFSSLSTSALLKPTRCLIQKDNTESMLIRFLHVESCAAVRTKCWNCMHSKTMDLSNKVSYFLSIISKNCNHKAHLCILSLSVQAEKTTSQISSDIQNLANKGWNKIGNNNQLFLPYIYPSAYKSSFLSHNHFPIQHSHGDWFYSLPKPGVTQCQLLPLTTHCPGMFHPLVHTNMN